MQTETLDNTRAQNSNQAQTQTATQPITPSLTATAPGQLKVIKRNGTVVSLSLIHI